MLSAASFLKQLLQEKWLVFNPLPELAPRKLVTLPRGTVLPLGALASVRPKITPTHAYLNDFQQSGKPTNPCEARTPGRIQVSEQSRARAGKGSGLATEVVSRAERSLLAFWSGFSSLPFALFCASLASVFGCPLTVPCLPPFWARRSSRLVAGTPNAELALRDPHSSAVAEEGCALAPQERPARPHTRCPPIA